ncbi:MAG: hypothetical protein LBQ61_08870 [Spirochaetales bacterium]|jgi:hypothetical protein|nr:hypothetical protein [Spirochaetales bacterium]
MNNEGQTQAQEYWNEKESLYGGRTEYRAFVRLLGSAPGGGSERAGLLFVIGGKVIFEDFERERGFWDILTSGKNRAPYQKTLLELKIEEIQSIVLVSQSQAKARISGRLPACRPVSGPEKIFSVIIHEVNMEGGTAWYFEILSTQGLKAFLEARKKDPPEETPPA